MRDETENQGFGEEREGRRPAAAENGGLLLRLPLPLHPLPLSTRPASTSPRISALYQAAQQVPGACIGAYSRPGRDWGQWSDPRIQPPSAELGLGGPHQQPAGRPQSCAQRPQVAADLASACALGAGSPPARGPGAWEKWGWSQAGGRPRLSCGLSPRRLPRGRPARRGQAPGDN